MLIRILVFLCIATVSQAQETLPHSILPGQPCHGQEPCELDGRLYHVKEPDGWDGITPLPVVLHFHGWGRTGATPVYHARISGATRRRGVLLVAPTGINQTWDFWTGRDEDVSFANAVLQDVAARYPIDHDRLFVSGYSFGSAMAWRFACISGDGVTALLAVAGSIRQTESCPQAPDEVRHVHGLSDTVMDFPIGPGDDMLYPVALWRLKFGCGSGHAQTVWNVTQADQFERHDWTNCTTGKRVMLDLHPRGHFIPKGWIGRQLDELLGRDPTYP